jgi:hypothetical protein
MGWSVWMEVARRSVLGGMRASGDRGSGVGGHGTQCLHLRVEREGEERGASKWERERGRRLGLHTCANLKRRVGREWSIAATRWACFVLDILSLPIVLNGENQGERNEIEPKKYIYMVGKIHEHHETT